jgi:zinc transporter ZupT
MTDVWFALGLTLFAGLATGIGSIIAFTAKRTNYRFLSVSTGFSAGVMLYVSFVEILFKGSSALVESFGDPLGHWVNTASFFAGILLIAVIDNLIPATGNPHETHSEAVTAPLHDEAAPLPLLEYARRATDAPPHEHAIHPDKLMRMGLFTALAIGIHNFPEGLATFLAALHDPTLGIAIAVAVALHNIPEGISVSVPIYYATGNLFPQRSGRAGRRRCRLPRHADVLRQRQRRGHPRRDHGGAVRRRCRDHGLHQPRRTAPHQPRLRQGARQPVRPDRRHGGDGVESAADEVSRGSIKLPGGARWG